MRMTSLLILLMLAGQSFTEKPGPAAQPNVILIFLDDMGNGDLGVTGALDYQTPNIDRMANEGVRFTNFVTAQAVCSASRTGLLTGCYPNRLGISGALFPTDSIGINPAETTMAEMLKQKGYATSAIGKWHLGHHKMFLPLQHGFDEYFGIPYSNDMWPVMFDGTPAPETHRKFKLPVLPLIKGNEKFAEIKTLDDQATLTKRYTEEAVSFIKRNSKKPFFLYMPHSMPHVPIAASAQFKGKSKQGMFGDVMMEIDWSVGEIIRTLKEQGIDKNTIVIFTSDNGPWLNFGNHAGSSSGFREGKGTVWEGGLRVPCIVRWKGSLQEGVVCNKLSSTIDIMPTLAAITGTRLPAHNIDGVNLLPLLEGKDVTPRREFYYYYGKNGLRAVRLDDWKLMLPHNGQSYENQLPGNDGFPGETKIVPVALALYDLRRDPGERYDVKDKYPEIVATLQKLATQAREDLGDDITQVVGKNVRPVGRMN
jgi:arylsulfatase A-like enzyme